MDYKEEYKKKLCDIDTVLSKIKSNDSIVVSMAASQPVRFLSNLHKIKDRVENVDVISCLLLKDYEFLHYADKENAPFTLESWYLGNPDRPLYKQSKAAFIPNNLHAAANDKLQAKHINVFVASATPMDKHGYFSLSLCLVYEKEMIENADMVILEVNSNYPKTYGDTLVHINDVDYVFESDEPLLEVPSIEATEVERKIGENVSELIEDGSTIQIGIGGIPNAIIQFINNRKELGIHTEMITEGMVDLIEKGIVTNSRKTLFKGKTLGSFVMGTKRLYDFVNENVSVEIRRGSYVNDPYIVAQNEKMISINTCLQLDLSGQVCSESFGYQQYTGTGGQLDMHRGATMSKGGKGIIAMRSTVKNDTISTIMPTLSLGSYVTIPRQDVDYIVTEYGIAHLRGKNSRERALALINIAHPNFRDFLKSEAAKMNLI
jgi:acyl-CoA hydrolase